MLKKIISLLAITIVTLLCGCSDNHQQTPPRYNCGPVNYDTTLKECQKNCQAVDPACNPLVFLPATTRCEQMCKEHYRN